MPRKTPLHQDTDLSTAELLNFLLRSPSTGCWQSKLAVLERPDLQDFQ